MRSCLSNGVGYLDGKYTLPTCPACGSCLYSDRRAAYTFLWEGYGWGILRCDVCHCVYVVGNANKAHEAHHTRAAESNDVDHWWIIQEHNKWYNEDMPWGDDMRKQPSATAEPIIIEGRGDA